MTTIAEHNRGRWNGLFMKSDYIVGITLNGGFYCADCVAEQDVDAPNEGYGPNPVFVVDEYHELVCDTCNKYALLPEDD